MQNLKTALRFQRITCNSGRHFAGNSELFPVWRHTLQFSQCFPLMAFGGKQFHCQMSCDHDLANEWARCSGKNASYITSLIIFQFQFPSLETVAWALVHKCFFVCVFFHRKQNALLTNAKNVISVITIFNQPCKFWSFKPEVRYPMLKIGKISF